MVVVGADVTTTCIQQRKTSRSRPARACLARDRTKVLPTFQATPARLPVSPSGKATPGGQRRLAEQGLATVDACEDGDVARATERGVDVALGRALSPGVRVPD